MTRPGDKLEVLFEDNHLLVVNKPAMLPTMGVAESEPSLLKVAREYIRDKYAKPGNVYLGIVSRLDTPVTGVTILARTSKAAARLSAAFRDRQVQKTYWAVVEGNPTEPTATIEHHLRKDERHRKVHVTHANAPRRAVGTPQLSHTCSRQRLVALGNRVGNGQKASDPRTVGEAGSSHCG